MAAAQPAGLRPPALLTRLDALGQAGAEDLLHLGEERLGEPEVGVLQLVLGQDQHGQLGQPVAGEHVDGPAVDHLAGGREAVAVEAAAVGDRGIGRAGSPVQARRRSPSLAQSESRRIGRFDVRRRRQRSASRIEQLVRSDGLSWRQRAMGLGVTGDEPARRHGARRGARPSWPRARPASGRPRPTSPTATSTATTRPGTGATVRRPRRRRAARRSGGARRGRSGPAGELTYQVSSTWCTPGSSGLDRRRARAAPSASWSCSSDVDRSTAQAVDRRPRNAPSGVRRVARPRQSASPNDVEAPTSLVLRPHVAPPGGAKGHESVCDPMAASASERGREQRALRDRRRRRAPASSSAGWSVDEERWSVSPSTEVVAAAARRAGSRGWCVTPWIGARDRYAHEAADGLVARRPRGDDLGQQRVEVGGDLVRPIGVAPNRQCRRVKSGRRRRTGEQGSPVDGSQSWAGPRRRAAPRWRGRRCRRRPARTRAARPGRTGSGSSTRSTAGDLLGDAVLDLERVFISRKKNSPRSASSRNSTVPDAVVADRLAPARPRPRRAARAGTSSTAGDGRLLDELLVAALDRALALAQVDDVAVLVGDDLDLDVAGRREPALGEHRAVAEGGLRLASGRSRPRRPARPRSATRRMPAATAAGRRLDQQRVADGTRPGPATRTRRRPSARRSAASARRPRRRAAWPRACRPSRAIASGWGPTQVRPASTTARAKRRSRTGSRSPGGRRRRPAASGGVEQLGAGRGRSRPPWTPPSAHGHVGPVHVRRRRGRARRRPPPCACPARGRRR